MLAEVEARAAFDMSPTVQNHLENAVRLTLMANRMIKDNR